MQIGQSRSCSEGGQREADSDGGLEEPFPIKATQQGKRKLQNWAYSTGDNRLPGSFSSGFLHWA